jgi:hypothetical protein
MCSPAAVSAPSSIGTSSMMSARRAGRQLRVLAKRADAAKGLQVSLLQDVFRFRVVLHDAARGAVQRPVEAAHQLLERALVAGGDLRGELRIRERRRDTG